MMDKNYIETLLATSGVPPSSSPEEIRPVLVMAGFTDSDIESALALLRTDSSDGYMQKEALRKIIRTNQQLRPAEVSALLGVDLVVKDRQMEKRQERKVSLILYLIMGVISIILAVLVAFAVMYTHKVGFFYDNAVASE